MRGVLPLNLGLSDGALIGVATAIGCLAIVLLFAYARVSTRKLVVSLLGVLAAGTVALLVWA